MTSLTIAKAFGRSEPRPRAARAWLGVARRIMILGILFVISAFAIHRGLQTRETIWRDSQPIRFTGDINNAWNWGSRVNRDAKVLAGEQKVGWSQLIRAFVAIYPKVAAAHATDGRYGLDYPPGRLLVVSAWVKTIREKFPDATGWRDEFTTPMLWTNTAAALVGSVAAFFLVRLWVRRDRGTSTHAGWILGLLAGLLLWFNPAVLAGGHAWPQWDVWIVPFFLLACLFASVECWILLGITLAMGAMLKGQLLIVSPFFILWPLFRADFHAALRVLIGMGMGFGLLTSPWLIQNERALLWSLNLIAGAGVVAVWMRLGLRPRSWIVVFAFTLALLVWPKLSWGYGRFLLAGSVVSVLLVGWPWLIGRRLPATLFTGAIACTLFAAAYLFAGDFGWARVGFLYAADHYQAMHMGPVNNLSRLLHDYYKWELYDVVGTLPGMNKPLTIQILLRGIFYLLLALCAFAAARAARNRSARVLVCMSAPFALMFAFLPQMHERYLLYAAAVSVIGIGASISMGLLHIVTTLLATSMILACMIGQNSTFAPRLIQVLNQSQPGMSWAVIGMALIYLVAGLFPGRMQHAKNFSPSSSTTYP